MTSVAVRFVGWYRWPISRSRWAIGMIQLLPIDETAPGETSPYSAMSVLAIDPLYISTRGLFGIDAADLDAARAIAGPGDPPDPLKLNAER